MVSRRLLHRLWIQCLRFLILGIVLFLARYTLAITLFPWLEFPSPQVSVFQIVSLAIFNQGGPASDYESRVTQFKMSSQSLQLSLQVGKQSYLVMLKKVNNDLMGTSFATLEVYFTTKISRTRILHIKNIVPNNHYIQVVPVVLAEILFYFCFIFFFLSLSLSLDAG